MLPSCAASLVASDRVTGKGYFARQDFKIPPSLVPYQAGTMGLAFPDIGWYLLDAIEKYLPDNRRSLMWSYTEALALDRN